MDHDLHRTRPNAGHDPLQTVGRVGPKSADNKQPQTVSPEDRAAADESDNPAGLDQTRIDRRRLLKQSAAGAAAIAAPVMATPSIAGIGTAPAFAMCASAGEAPTPAVTCTSGEVVCTETITTGLTPSGTQTQGQQPAIALLQDAFTNVPLSIEGDLLATIGPICPGQTISWNPTATLDLCSIFNTRLAAIAAQVTGPGASVDNFAMTISSVSLGGVDLDNESLSGSTDTAPCPQDVLLPTFSASWGQAEAVLNEASCIWECSLPDPVLQVPDLTFTANIAATLAVTLGISADFVGGITLDVTGSFTQSCEPDFSATVTCD